MPEFLPGSNLVTLAEPSYDLSVHNRSAVSVFSDPELAEKIRADGRFVRAVMVDLPNGADGKGLDDLVAGGLDAFLRRTDDALDAITSTVGATVADHKWVAFPYDGPEMPFYFGDISQRRTIGLPEGYILGVDVEYVEGITLGMNKGMSHKAFFMMSQNLLRRAHNFGRANGWLPRDIQPHQFRLETKPDEEPPFISKPRHIKKHPVKLTDIELLFFALKKRR